MGCDSQFDGYFDGERKVRARDEAEMRRKVRHALGHQGQGAMEVDAFVAAVKAIIRLEQ